MTYITVLAPSKGRPADCLEMWRSAMDTATNPLTLVFPILDAHDPMLSEYSLTFDYVSIITTGNMVQRTNSSALLQRLPKTNIIGWCADDNRFRTEGWDDKVLEAFHDPSVGMVNTNDELVGDTKGGVYFMRLSIIKELGYMLLPTLEHLYADFAASELFKAAGAYKYLEDVVIEHLHPWAGKAEWTPQYKEYNNSTQDNRDGTAYWAWRNGPEFTKDVEVIKSCLQH